MQCSRERRIKAQLVVVVEVLVGERDAENALPQQVCNRAVTASTCDSCESTWPNDRSAGSRGRQHSATIRGDRTASEVHFALATLCRHRGASPAQTKSLSQNHFLLSRSPKLLTAEKVRQATIVHDQRHCNPPRRLPSNFPLCAGGGRISARGNSLALTGLWVRIAAQWFCSATCNRCTTPIAAGSVGTSTIKILKPT